MALTELMRYLETIERSVQVASLEESGEPIPQELRDRWMKLRDERIPRLETAFGLLMEEAGRDENSGPMDRMDARKEKEDMKEEEREMEPPGVRQGRASRDGRRGRGNEDGLVTNATKSWTAIDKAVFRRLPRNIKGIMSMDKANELYRRIWDLMAQENRVLSAEELMRELGDDVTEPQLQVLRAANVLRILPGRQKWALTELNQRRKE